MPTALARFFRKFVDWTGSPIARWNTSADTTLKTPSTAAARRVR
jgi:hypothetical protein